MNAFDFGRHMRIKLAAGPGMPAPTSSLTGKPTLPTQPAQSSTSGTMSLARPNAAPRPALTTTSITAPKAKPVSNGTGQPPASAGSHVARALANKPNNSWGGYITDTNKGLMKDVGDTFTHFIPQNTMPWTEAWQSAPERYKNLPVDRGLAIAGTAAAGTALAAGTAAAALPAVAPTLASMPLFGSGGATAGTVAGGVGAGSQTPMGQNIMQRASETAGMLGNFAQRGMQTANNVAHQYQQNIEPALKRVGYSPEDVAHDSYAAITGNYDKLKGPGWGAVGLKFPSLPTTSVGVSGLPRPAQAAKDIYNIGRDIYGASRAALNY